MAERFVCAHISIRWMRALPSHFVAFNFPSHSFCSLEARNCVCLRLRGEGVFLPIFKFYGRALCAPHFFNPLVVGRTFSQEVFSLGVLRAVAIDTDIRLRHLLAKDFLLDLRK